MLNDNYLKPAKQVICPEFDNPVFQILAKLKEAPSLRLLGKVHKFLSEKSGNIIYGVEKDRQPFFYLFSIAPGGYILVVKL